MKYYSHLCLVTHFILENLGNSVKVYVIKCEALREPVWYLVLQLTQTLLHFFQSDIFLSFWKGKSYFSLLRFAKVHHLNMRSIYMCARACVMLHTQFIIYFLQFASFTLLFPQLGLTNYPSFFSSFFELCNSINSKNRISI